MAALNFPVYNITKNLYNITVNNITKNSIITKSKQIKESLIRSIKVYIKNFSNPVLELYSSTDVHACILITKLCQSLKT